MDQEPQTPQDTKLADMRRKLDARSGTLGYEENIAEMRREIAVLEGLNEG